MEKNYKILVTGANGQLGSELQVLSKNTKHTFYFTDVDQLNITKPGAIENFMDENPVDFVINCAAYTAVDKAESDKDAAFLLNAVAVDFLVDACEKNNTTLIHVSTDYVFDGTKNTPYMEDDPTIPQSIYGDTKNEGEKLILYSEINALILRTSWLYSTFGNNFVKTMLKLGADKDAINVVFDQVGTPTYARHLASGLLQIINQLEITEEPFQEIYHFTNQGVASWYDFACEIFRQKNIHCKVNPVDTSQFPTAAKRPAFSVLSKQKITRDFDIDIPHWVDGLKEMLSNL